MHIVAVPVFGIIFNLFLQCIEANLTLDFKVTKISASHKPANCNVANTTYSHGETFKLDCKTQCVCENGRHACSSLCPKEQLPAPEDTISCRSPRLVEVPGHCCKMWLCENPTADVYATCHNSSTSPWTPCSRKCGLGLSTRFTTTTAGCNQLSNLRLCENRKCETQQDNTDAPTRQHKQNLQPEEAENRDEKINQKYFRKTKQLKHKLKRQHRAEKQRQAKHWQEHLESEHRIRKGHECRSLQRLGPARVRLGQCVSKKLYRPKICGRCHQNTKCCVPSVSTTIQVELFCPLNAMDPISFVQQQLKTEQHQGQLFYPKSTTTTSTDSSSLSTTLTSLWDTQSLDAIDQEYLQSHQIQIANKFIAVEWILKCECTKNDNCQRIVNTTTTIRKGDKSLNAKSSSRSSGSASNSNININNRRHHDRDDSENTETGNNLHNNKIMQKTKYFKLNRNNYSKIKKNSMFYKDYNQQKAEAEAEAAAAATEIDKIPDDYKNVDDQNDNLEKDVYGNEDNEQNDSDININNVYSNSKRNPYTHLNSFSHNKQTQDYVGKNKRSNSNSNKKQNKQTNSQYYVGDDENDDKDEEIVNVNGEENEWSTSLLSATSLSSSLSSSATSVSAEEAAGVATSSDETQPDIIPYPPPPFSANSHTSNNKNKTNTNNNNNNSSSNENTKNSYKNTQTNWIKEKFKLENNKQQQQHQQKQEHQQQLYENWLLQQYNNNRPHKAEIQAT